MDVESLVTIPHHNPYFRCSPERYGKYAEKKDNYRTKQKKITRDVHTFRNNNNGDCCYHYLRNIYWHCQNRLTMASTRPKLHLTTTPTFTNADQQHFCVCLLLRIGCGFRGNVFLCFFIRIFYMLLILFFFFIWGSFFFLAPFLCIMYRQNYNQT